jgi:2-methylcitrate dehydratase PrpD
VSALRRPADAGPDIVEFACGLRWADIPEDARRYLAWLLLDFAAVCSAGRTAPAADIAATYARNVHATGPCTSLYDGARLAAPGAAWTNGVLANVLDYDDGHRITKGHPGAIIIPAALAAGEASGASMVELMEAIAVGYELAVRAGIRLHATEEQYHASAAWGALGAAAAAARLLGLDPGQVRHAVGLAEYHAPIALMPRAVADPAMTKDATGWGAFIGISSAMLADGGFTALGSAFLHDADAGADLGSRWEVLGVYVKAYPCCRWSQPAIEAALQVRGRIDPAAIDRVTIHTFTAADGLSTRRPRTTEDMQYSLVWPVAAALADGAFDVAGVLSEFADARVEQIAARTAIVVDPEIDAAFPGRRLARVVVESAGAAIDSGLVEARGEPGDPSWQPVIEDKARRFLDPGLTAGLAPPADPPDARLGGSSAAELLALLTYGRNP